MSPVHIEGYIALKMALFAKNNSGIPGRPPGIFLTPRVGHGTIRIESVPLNQAVDNLHFCFFRGDLPRSADPTHIHRMIRRWNLARPGQHRYTCIPVARLEKR